MDGGIDHPYETELKKSLLYQANGPSGSASCSHCSRTRAQVHPPLQQFIPTTEPIPDPQGPLIPWLLCLLRNLW